MSIVIDNISFSYGEKQLFHDFSLVIPDVARIAFTGPSGCGKTTLARLAAGLERPQRGCVSGYPETVSFVFQENRLIPTMSVLDNAAVTGDRETAARILGELGLGGEFGRMPAELSGGMARRTALARALAHRSPLIVLDEAFAGLDPDSAELAAACVRRWAEGRTLIAVTHSSREAELLGAEIYTVGAAG